MRGADDQQDAGEPPEPAARAPAPNAQIRKIRDIQHVSESCSMPATLLGVLRAASNPRCTIDGLVHVIERDPDLSLRVIRVGNSAFYAAPLDLPREARPPATNLRIAVRKLGFATVRNLAFTQGIFRLARQGTATGHAILGHLLMVAEIARRIGRRFGRAPAEDAYFMGLMHDFGKLALLKALPDEYGRVIELCQRECLTAREAENRVLGAVQPLLLDHVHAGAELLRAFGIPEAIVIALQTHHELPSVLRELGRSRRSPSPSTVACVANWLAYGVGCGDGLAGRNPYSFTPADLLAPIGLSPVEQQELLSAAVASGTEAMEEIGMPNPLKTEDEIRSLQQHGVKRWPDPFVQITEAQEYEICLTMIQLARARARVSLSGFMAHTGLGEEPLTHYLREFVRCGYLLEIDQDREEMGYKASSLLRSHDLPEILLSLLDREELGSAEAA